MSNITLIELREDTADNNNSIENAGSFQVTLNEPLILKNNDQLSLSSVFVDSVATNSGKIVISDDETEFTIKNYIYFNNYGDIASKPILPYRRPLGTNTDGSHIVKGLNDGFDYVACDNTGSISVGAFICPQLRIFINMQHFVDGHLSEKQDATTFHFTYTSLNDKLVNFTMDLSKQVNLTKMIARAGTNSDGTPKQGFYTTDDYKDDFGEFPAGFPFDFKGTISSINIATPFITNDRRSGKLHGGFLNQIDFPKNVAYQFDGIRLAPMIFTYNFTIASGAYDPSEFARVITDKLASQNVTTTDPLNFIDTPDTDKNKYLSDSRSFNSPYLNLGKKLKAIQTDSTQFICCRHDGEGIIKVSADDWLVGSTQCGLEFDIEQNKFFFSQLHSPFYNQPSGVPSMGTSFVNVLNVVNGSNSQSKVATDFFFTANKNGGVGFTDLQPSSVWFDKMGMNPNILTNFATKIFSTNAAGIPTTTAQYKDIETHAQIFTDLSPITFTMNDGIQTTGNFTSLDSAIDKTTPRIAPDLSKLSDTSNILKQIYARSSLNEGGSLPYYLIEIDGKGINSDIRGSLASAINNTKISGIVSRFYQTQSYTSSIDGSGAIPYIHRGEPLIIDSFKVRILDPNGELTENIQDSNVVFLQHTSAQ